MGKLMGVEQLFEGRHFDREVIILCVRWYLRFKLSLRRPGGDEWPNAACRWPIRTIMRWVWRYAPEFEKRWKRFAQAVGRSWRVDETSKFEANGAISIVPWIGRGGTVDFRLSAKRDVAAAKAFFARRSKASTMLPGRSLWTAMPRLTARCVS